MSGHGKGWRLALGLALLAGAVLMTACKPKEKTEMKEKPETPPAATGGPNALFPLTEADKIELLKIARASAEAAVKGEKPPAMETQSENLKKIGAAFVTLKTRGQLRGCIGTIMANEPLYQCVQRRAVDAAINDSRFFMNRITPAEFQQLEIEISVLTPTVPAKPEEIVVGRDGVLLSVGPYRGVFLPQVPTEQGWDHDAYLNNLCHKAGSGDPNCWKRPDAKLERFEAIVFSEHEMGL